MVIHRSQYNTGRFTARPHQAGMPAVPTTGLHSLQLDSKKDGLLYVPATYHRDKPAALALMLHGAGGQPAHGLSLLQQYADAHNMILLAPASRDRTWDIIVNSRFNTDVIFIDQALQQVFARYAIDPAHLAIGGFSDGASYALCLGLTNGDLITHVLAFSPGFAFAFERRGKPQAFISHGLHDQVLPIDPCSRRVVPQLQQQGLAVTYLEFDGAHDIPATISRKGVEWFMGKSPQQG